MWSRLYITIFFVHVLEFFYFFYFSFFIRGGDDGAENGLGVGRQVGSMLLLLLIHPGGFVLWFMKKG